MKLLLAAFPVCTLIACTEARDEVETDEVESAGTVYQGTVYQGTVYQGTVYQGTVYQGTVYQGTVYQGASYGGTVLSDAASLSGTALRVWTRKPATKGGGGRGENGSPGWQQRFPDKICDWNSLRTIQSGCTSINLATTASPLAGVQFPGTFTNTTTHTTFTGTIQIGTSSTQVGAVVADNSLAMHPAGSGAFIGYGGTNPADGSRCDNPNGCRVNSDLWMYDVKLFDANNQPISFCAAGGAAIALPGVYDATGQRTGSNSTFTFACTNGTIAKCTRWGFRSFGNARRYTAQSGCPADYNSYPLADYHQACVRAATGDYCSNGHPFTKNGTMVDLYDRYQVQVGSNTCAYAMVPRTRGGVVAYNLATAFVLESGFDKTGAHQIDHLRYAELEGTQSYGSILDPTVGCPDRFQLGGSDDVQSAYMRDTQLGAWSNPTIWVDSTPACAHSEWTKGKWLHPDCSSCTTRFANHATYHYCTDPSDPRGWDAACAAAVSTVCSGASKMEPHGECSTGSGLQKYGSGCAIAVCSDPAYASCCNAGSTSWTSACTNAASAKCGFAKNPGGGPGSQLTGFCPLVVGP